MNIYSYKISKKQYGNLFSSNCSCFSCVSESDDNFTDEFNIVIENINRYDLNDDIIYDYEKINILPYDDCIEIVTSNSKELKTQKLSLSKFNKYVYILDAVIYESNEFTKSDALFLQNKFVHGIYTDERDAINDTLNVFNPYIDKVIDNLYDFGENMTDDEIKEQLMEYSPIEFIIKKIPINYIGYPWNSIDSVQLGDTKSMAPDELYDNLMRYVLCEERHFDHRGNFVYGEWKLKDRTISKSYEDFNPDKKCEFKLGDVVKLSDEFFGKDYCTSSDFIYPLKHYSGKYVVSHAPCNILESENPLLWSNTVDIYGINDEGEYQYYPASHMWTRNDIMKLVTEPIDKNSFIGKLKKDIIDGKGITYENFWYMYD